MGRKLMAYSRSFHGNGAVPPTDEERAGLVGAIGWFGGWAALGAAEVLGRP
jgi:hypothetical protein